MIRKTLALFAATSSLSVALANDGNKSGTCDMAAKAAKSADLTAVEGTVVTLAVSGVTCGGTAAAFHAAVMKSEGVTGATVDAETGKAEVKYDAAKLNVDRLIAAVAESSNFEAKPADEA